MNVQSVLAVTGRAGLYKGPGGEAGMMIQYNEMVRMLALIGARRAVQ